MEPIRLKIDNNILEKMKKYYNSQTIVFDSEDYVFKAKVIGCFISVNNDLMVEFEGDNAIDEAKIWSKKIAKVIEEKPPVSNDHYFSQHHIGAAETGSLDYIGPLCIVSCYVSEEEIEFLKSLNIPHPSSLSNQEIISYAKQIYQKIKHEHISSLILDNTRYNSMISEKNLNLASIKSKLYNQATVNVMQKVKQNVKVKVINQFVSPRTYYNYLKNDVIVVRDIQFESDAESKYLAVVAANILSQYFYLQYFSNLTKSLKMNLVRGTSSSADMVAAKIALKYGQNILPKVVKMNFTNTKKVKNILDKM